MGSLSKKENGRCHVEYMFLFFNDLRVFQYKLPKVCILGFDLSFWPVNLVSFVNFDEITSF